MKSWFGAAMEEYQNDSLTTTLSSRLLMRCLWKYAQTVPHFQDALAAYPNVRANTTEHTVYDAIFFKEFLGIDGGRFHAMRGAFDERLLRFAGHDISRLKVMNKQIMATSASFYLANEGYEIGEKDVYDLMNEELAAMGFGSRRGRAA